MKKFFAIFSGGVWPIVILLALILGLVFFGIEFNRRGNVISAHKQEMKDLKKEHKAVLDSARTDLKTCQKELKVSNGLISDLKKQSKSDSINYAKTIALTQQTCVALKTDRDYWKDFAQKLETGDFCVEKYGWLKKKTRLVPRKITP